MPILSLLLTVLLVLGGGLGTAWAEAPSADVPIEAPASHDVPVEVEETDGEEEAVHMARPTQGADGVASPTPNEAEVASMGTTLHSPPPER